MTDILAGEGSAAVSLRDAEQRAGQRAAAASAVCTQPVGVAPHPIDLAPGRQADALCGESRRI